MGEPVREGRLGCADKGQSSLRIAWIHNGNMGGSKRFAFEMVRNLAALGHVIDEFIVRGSVSDVDYLPLTPFVRASSEVVLLRPDMSWLRPYLVSSLAQLVATSWNTWKINQPMKELAETINAGKYDYVHIDQHPGCRAINLMPYLRKPTVVYSHEPSVVRYQGLAPVEKRASISGVMRCYNFLCDGAQALSSYLMERHDIAVTNLAQLILTNSYFSKEVLFQHYRCYSNVCYAGVDCSDFEPAALPVEPMVLSAGRIIRTKQHHLVIEAVALIGRAQRPRVVIATPEHVERSEDPDYSEELRRMAKESGVDLTITYRPSQPELANLYRRALALVFVSIMEPFGLVAIEAMASGTPVIGIKEAAVRESVIDGITGILVDRDVEQIAAAIVYLQQHKEKRNEMGRQAGEHVRAHWTWACTVKRYEEEVRKMLSTRSRPTLLS